MAADPAPRPAATDQDDQDHRLALRVDHDAPQGDALAALARLLRSMRDRAAAERRRREGGGK